MHVLLTLIRQQLLGLVHLNLVRCSCLGPHVANGCSMHACWLLVLLLLLLLPLPLQLLLVRSAVAQHVPFKLIPVRYSNYHM
jgi:hypothetical protein